MLTRRETSGRGAFAFVMLITFLAAFMAGYFLRELQAERQAEMEAALPPRVTTKPINFAWDVPCPELREICKGRERSGRITFKETR